MVGHNLLKYSVFNDKFGITHFVISVIIDTDKISQLLPLKKQSQILA